MSLADELCRVVLCRPRWPCWSRTPSPTVTSWPQVVMVASTLRGWERVQLAAAALEFTFDESLLSVLLTSAFQITASFP